MYDHVCYLMFLSAVVHRSCKTQDEKTCSNPGPLRMPILINLSVLAGQSYVCLAHIGAIPHLKKPC